MKALTLRWTIGDVSPLGFDSLNLSIWGAWRIFGERARYSVCYNRIALDELRERVGLLPTAIEWHAVQKSDLPEALARKLDESMAEGTAWKLAPLRLHPEDWELSLDNDCILWRMPEALRAWLEDDVPSVLMAEDVLPCFGIFAPFCAPQARNSGIRGLPPSVDLAAEILALLEEVDQPLRAELDEQGLQVAALQRRGKHHVVSLSDVSICSPFPPHLPDLGRAGAHFGGLNAKHLPWEVEGKPASEFRADHYLRLRPEIETRLQIHRAAASGSQG